MKFKISKLSLDLAKRTAEGSYEIGAELINDTATEAIIRQNIENNAYHKGYHYGFKEGFYQGRKLELKYCGCGCGGNNFHLRFCNDFCKFYNK